MEQHRVLIVIVSMTLFLAVVLGAGLWLFYPREEERQPLLAELPAQDEGRVFDPIEYLRGEEDLPGLEAETEEEEDGDIIIVYGESDAETAETDESPAAVRSREPVAEDRTAASEDRATTPAPPSSGRPRVVSESATDTPGPAPSPAPASEPRQSAPIENSRPDAATAAPARPSARAQESAATTPAAPRTETRREYWIQVISSPSLDTVEQAKARLKEWTISGVITSTTKDATVYYRLRIGPYSEKDEAEKFLEWVGRIEGFGTSYISLVYNQRPAVN